MSIRDDTFITTYTGRQFHPLDMRAGDVVPLDIAHSLSMICRYNGHISQRYSVAEHCVLMYDRAVQEGWPEEVCKQVLMHDAPETYTGDLISPLKKMEELAYFKELEHFVEQIVFEKFNIPLPMPPIVKELDLAIREAETRDLRNGIKYDKKQASKFAKVHAWTPSRARWHMIRRMRQVGIEVPYV